MTPQERDLIQALFGRLQQAGNQPKDRDADALIRQGIAQVPDAPYSLVQTVIIQDMALNEAQNRIKEMERQLAEAKTPEQPTSFLAGARGSVPAAGGPWGRPAASPAQAGGSVWTQQGTPPAAPVALAAGMAPLAMPGASSGFLRQAATTAAGIAGGALLFEGISSLFGQHYGGMLSGMQAQPGIGETVINNYYNDTPQSQAPDARQANADYGADAGTAQADDGQDFASDQDFGSDSGGSADV